MKLYHFTSHKNLKGITEGGLVPAIGDNSEGADLTPLECGAGWMGLSLAEAARQAGISKSSVWRAVRDGRLKAKRSRNGRFAIEPDELTRVFPALDPDVTSGAAKGRYYVPRGVEMAVRLAQPEQQVADLTAALKEARQDRDRWQLLAERLASKTKR
jgi:hypothetical protein